MKNFNYSQICSEIDNNYFLAVYKDRLEDTWYNICFVNNSKEGIKYLKMEAVESRFNKTSELNEVLAALTSEYVSILPGEYLLLEKLDSQDDRVDEYKYNFTLEVEEKLINISYSFKRNNFSIACCEEMIPIVNEAGKVYSCV